MKEFQNVVLTGVGAITSRGDFTLNDASTPLSGFSSLQANTGAFNIENFALENYLASQKTYLDRCSALALAGCGLALRDAGIESDSENAGKFGITLGTHFGCIETMKSFWDKAEEKGVRLANPLLFSHSYFNSPISLCAIEFGLKGYHATFCAGEYSGLEASRAAFDAIRLGHAEGMICGGVDALTPTRVLCASEKRAGEAAVFFVLESEARALQRGARSTRALSESWFEIDSAEQETESQFGHCGGAGSTLALARTALVFTQS